jgi:hypothetical protein
MGKKGEEDTPQEREERKGQDEKRREWVEKRVDEAEEEKRRPGG